MIRRLLGPLPERQARRDGVPIVADRSGYWLADTATDHAGYQEYRRRNGLIHLADAARDRHSNAAGQLALFDASDRSLAAAPEFRHQ